jgi:DNA polymerase-3 subunit alpha
MAKEELLAVLVNELSRRGLNDQKHKDRLKYELKEIEVQEEIDYFWDLYKNNVKYAKNEHNLLVPYLLGIVNDFNIDQEAAWVQGESPDIDVDFLPVVRDWLKNEWAPQTFGKDCVCSIGNYTTFGIKSALIDMVRVFGGNRQEILELTTKLDNRDDEGKPLTWDKAISSNPKLAEFCEKNPEIAKHAKHIINRNRGRGKHAGGLIISRSPLNDVVPLTIDKDGMPVSAWTEGLHSQDLAPMGYVKYDLLVVTNLIQIAKAVKIIKERHGVTSICAKPGLQDWSDTSYLHDEKSLALAREGKLKCIFQFDSSGIRELVRKMGVTSFEDLVAATAIFRPGPLSCLPQNTMVSTNEDRKKIKDLRTWYDEIRYLSADNEVKSSKRFFLIKTGKKKIYKITTKFGNVVYSAENHKFLTKKGYYTVKDLRKNDEILHSDTI